MVRYRTKSWTNLVYIVLVRGRCPSSARPVVSRGSEGSWPSLKVQPRTICLLRWPAPERARLFPQLELVAMPLGKVLYESGSELDHVYFPTNCIVSLLYVMDGWFVGRNRSRGQ